MSNFLSLAQEVMATKTITPEMAQQIDQLLWSREFSPAEIAVLRKLEYMLTEGLVTLTLTKPVEV